MVDNLAEKVNECPLNWDPWVLFAYNWDCEKCPLYRVAGCPLFKYWSEWRTVGTFRIVRYIVGVCCWGVFVKRGSTVLFFTHIIYIYCFYATDEMKENREIYTEEGITHILTYWSLTIPKPSECLCVGSTLRTLTKAPFWILIDFQSAIRLTILLPPTGVRWQCSHCTFLNHPLMSRCESCDLPKINSRQGTVQSWAL